MDGLWVDGSIECPRGIARTFGCWRAADVLTANADYSTVTTTTARKTNRIE
jgi:hypothetical protein